jgi:hypothetical protein
MPSCYLLTALAMRPGRSCGKLNISLGKWVNSPRADTSRPPLMRYPATMFLGLSLARVSCRAWSCCFLSEYYWHVKTNGATRNLGTIRMMIYTSRRSTRRETVLRSRSPRFVSVLIGALILRAHMILILRTGVLGFNGSSKSRL